MARGSGEAPGGYYGTAVSTAGDVNGDGYSDVMVGAYYADSYSGKAYVYPMGPCAPPVEEISISMVRLDNNRKPVLTTADPAPSPTVTGYNIYRAPSGRGPWTLVGLNVPEGEFTDPTGDIGGPWFYRIAAWHDACHAEGPR